MPAEHPSTVQTARCPEASDTGVRPSGLEAAALLRSILARDDGPEPPTIDPALSGFDRLRAIVVQSMAIRRAGVGLPFVHRRTNGERRILHVRHGGDRASVALEVALLATWSARCALHVEGESIGPETWAIHLQSVAPDGRAAADFNRFIRAATKLGLDASYENHPESNGDRTKSIGRTAEPRRRRVPTTRTSRRS